MDNVGTLEYACRSTGSIWCLRRPAASSAGNTHKQNGCTSEQLQTKPSPDPLRGEEQMPTIARIAASRLTLRCWDPKDAAQLRESVASSLTELKRVFPWAAREPLPLTETAQRLTSLRGAFLADDYWSYGMFNLSETMVIGGVDLRPGRADGDRELSYWVRTSCTRRGYATEAVSAMTSQLFSDLDVQRIVIRCQRSNTRGAAIPERLGYGLVCAGDDALDDGATGAMIWELTRARFSAVARLPAAARPWLN